MKPTQTCAHLAATLFTSLLVIQDSRAQSVTSHPALNQPDKFAWDLFTKINHPADLNASRGTPDLTKRLGEPGPAVWETWKLARTEVFLENGCKLPNWDDQPPTPKLLVANRAVTANALPLAQLKHFDPPNSAKTPRGPMASASRKNL
jgi:hypothetical protein